ncbi:MAG TPA: glycosyltransferase family 9 protein, partial [bacterium]|nr:glycosyltransferase family 9 protein [bacterium]
VQVIETARLLITTDSAPLHIGAASGTRTLALFGPTDPRRHCPPNVWFLSRSLACSPCYRKFCASLECLKSISAEEVLVQARRLLSEG